METKTNTNPATKESAMTTEITTTETSAIATAQKKTARKIALACYPEYEGRKIKVVSRATYYMDNAWGGGSRSYAVAFDFATGKTAEAVQCVGREVAIPAGVAIVEHAFFCGQDAGITIYVNPAADKFGLLQAAA